MAKREPWCLFVGFSHPVADRLLCERWAREFGDALAIRDLPTCEWMLESTPASLSGRA